MTVASCRKIRFAYILAAYFLLLAFAAHSLLERRAGFQDNVIGMTLGALVTMACAYDAAVLLRPWALGLRFAFLVFWPVALPLYILRTRGWWGALLLFLHFAVLFVAAFIWAIIAVARGMALPQ
jgi:hypothetical protein